MSWYYKNEEVTELPDCVGFVYKITCIHTGRKYLGKKLKYFTKTKTINIVLKSGVKKKKKIKISIESDWRDYFGSCVELQRDILELGSDNFYREIMSYEISKGNLSYEEARLQFHYNVLKSNDYYNGIISCKIHKKHLK